MLRFNAHLTTCWPWGAVELTKTCLAQFMSGDLTPQTHFRKLGFNMSDQGKASVPKAVKMRRQKRDNAAENDIKNIYNIFIKSNCFPFQSLFFQQSSYLIYDVHAKTAPKSLLNKFAKKTSLSCAIICKGMFFRQFL